jgi:hypothetical protein
MSSTAWEKMNSFTSVVITGDIKPWGGVSDTSIIEGARLRGLEVRGGSNFDEARIVIPTKAFGEETGYFLPIRIMGITGSNKDTVATTLFRGFACKNSGSLSASKEEMEVTLKDYKWYLSRRSLVRGRFFSIEGATASPAMLGTGNTSNKFVFERFRATIQDNGGYLQSVPCVFNQGGIPDCFTKNHTSSMVTFFYTRQTWDETKGFKSYYDVDPNIGAKVDWNGKFWSWATILAHLQKYWIDPYNSVQNQVEISVNDLSIIANINSEKRYPLDFNIDNMNVIAALDTIVSHMPGRWYWYLEYNQPTVRIRIREFDKNAAETVFLKVCDSGAKLATSGANVSEFTVERDGSDGAKYAIARGGKIKLVCTVKLVPLWQKYANGKDFTSKADFENYKEWLNRKYAETTNKEKTETTLTLSKADEKRYDRMYRYYAIPLRGETFLNTIATAAAASENNSADIKLTGFLAQYYSPFTTDVKRMLFNNVRLNREIEPPMFGHYADETVVFAYDEYNASAIMDTTVETKTEIKANNDLLEEEEETQSITILSDQKLGRVWLWAEENNGMGYKFDKASGVLIFNEPQFCQQRLPAASKSNRIFSNISTLYWDSTVNGQTVRKMQSREIYMTATFTFDIAAILGRELSHSIVDQYSGAPFTNYVAENDNDIIVHMNAWYPLKRQDTTDDVTANGANSNRTLNGHRCRLEIKACEFFDGYEKYVGLGAQELLRALLSYLEGYDRLDESVDATMPYLEMGYGIGDVIRQIYGTAYTDLCSAIVGIKYENVNDSDQFNTVLSFSNFYDQRKDNNGTRHHHRDKHKHSIGQLRENFEPVEKLEGVE